MKTTFYLLVFFLSFALIEGCSKSDNFSNPDSKQNLQKLSEIAPDTNLQSVTISPGANIQTYIDAAYAAGGGTVNLSSGTWTATGKTVITLKSNVTLNLNVGCVLSANQISNTPGARNIALTGSGKLIAATKSTVIALNTARKFTVSGITIDNSAGLNWTTRYDYCDSGYVSNINIQANITATSDDGIDLCNCRWITVNNNYIQSGDAGLSLKAWPNKPNGTNNIDVYGNTFYCPKYHCGSSIGIGNETNMEICDVNFHDNIISASTNYKYKLWVINPGPVHRIYYTNNSGATVADLQINTQNPGSNILYDVYYDGVKIY